MLKPIPTYSAEIDESTGGISIMSLVDRPAVEALFVKFSNETRIALSANTDRQVVTGVAMIPDFPIYRRDNLTGEYYVTFSKDAIMRAVEVFFRYGHTTSVNLNHETEAHECVIFESYLIDHARGIVPAEFSEYPDGTWIVSTKINDPALWADIKAGKYNGFSVEGKINLAPKPAEPTFKDMKAAIMEDVIKHFNIK